MRHWSGALALIVVIGCTSGAPRYARGPTGAEPTIRALLAQTEDEVLIRATGPFEVKTGAGVAVATGEGAATIRIERDETHMMVHLGADGGVTAAENEVVLVPGRVRRSRSPVLRIPARLSRVGTATRVSS